MRQWQMYLLLILSSPLIAQSQKLPAQHLFRSDTISKIYVKIDQEYLDLVHKYPFSNAEYPATVCIKHAQGEDIIEKVGFRIKGKTSRTSPKKSYKLSFNSFERGRKYHELEKLNLNAYWNDPTHLRAHLATDIYESAGIIVARSGFAELYINDIYYGFYNLMEHIDEEFILSRFGNNNGNLYKCFGGASLQYLGRHTADYKIQKDGVQIYELKTNKKADDYSGLIRFTRIMDKAPQDSLECLLLDHFNVLDYLKIMAIDVVIGNWDNSTIVANNFYLYEDPLSNKMYFIPFDFDNTFGIDWVGGDWAHPDVYSWHDIEPIIERIRKGESHVKIPESWKQWFIHSLEKTKDKPIFRRIIQIPVFRDMFTSHIRDLVNSNLSPLYFNSKVEQLNDLIWPSMAADTFDNYTMTQITSALNEPLPPITVVDSFVVNSLPYGLLSFVDSIHSVIVPQLEEPKGFLHWPCSRIRVEGDFLVVQIEAVQSLESNYLEIEEGELIERRMLDVNLKSANDVNWYSVRLPIDQYSEANIYLVRQNHLDESSEGCNRRIKIK